MHTASSRKSMGCREPQRSSRQQSQQKASVSGLLYTGLHSSLTACQSLVGNTFLFTLILAVSHALACIWSAGTTVLDRRQMDIVGQKRWTSNISVDYRAVWVREYNQSGAHGLTLTMVSGASWPCRMPKPQVATKLPRASSAARPPAWAVRLCSTL